MVFLASRSPRRAELLARLGVAFELLTLDVPEQRGPGEAALDYVQRVAREKAQAGLSQLDRRQDGVVLGADTEVILDDVVFGKPVDADDAGAMLARLSGRTHRVASAVALVSGARQAQVLNVSEVTFAELTPRAIAEYVATGESMGKAGAYAIQGRGEAFITHLSGSYSGVMGLPLHDVARLLTQFGVK